MIGLFEQPATVPDRRRHRFLLPRPVFHCSLSLSQVNTFFAIFLITFFPHFLNRRLFSKDRITPFVAAAYRSSPLVRGNNLLCNSSRIPEAPIVFP